MLSLIGQLEVRAGVDSAHVQPEQRKCITIKDRKNSRPKNSVVDPVSLNPDTDPAFQVNPDTDPAAFRVNPDPIRIFGFDDQNIEEKNTTVLRSPHPRNTTIHYGGGRGGRLAD